MPQELVDVDAFTSPVRAPNDGDDADAGSLVQGLQPLADRTRNVKNRVDAHDTAIADLQAATADAGLQQLYVHLAGGFNSGNGQCRYIGGSSALLICGDSDGFPAEYVVPVRLPQGAVISELGAIITPNADNLNVDLRRVDPGIPTTVATVIKTVGAAGGATIGSYLVTLTPPHTVDNVGGWYEIHILSGGDDAPAYVHAVALTANTLGVKNTQPL